MSSDFGFEDEIDLSPELLEILDRPTQLKKPDLSPARPVKKFRYSTVREEREEETDNWDLDYDETTGTYKLPSVSSNPTDPSTGTLPSCVRQDSGRKVNSLPVRGGSAATTINGKSYENAIASTSKVQLPSPNARSGESGLHAEIDRLRASLARAESDAASAKESLLVRDGEILHLRRRVDKQVSLATEVEKKYEADKHALIEQMRKVERDFENERVALQSKAAFQRQSIETSAVRNIFPPSTRRRPTRPISPTKSRIGRVFDDSPLSVRPQRRSAKKEDISLPVSIPGLGFQNSFAVGAKKVTSTQIRVTDSNSMQEVNDDVFGSRPMSVKSGDETPTPKSKTSPIKWKGKEKLQGEMMDTPSDSRDVEMTDYDPFASPEKNWVESGELEETESQTFSLARILFSHVTVSSLIAGASENTPFLTLRYLTSLKVPENFQPVFQERCENLFVAISRAQYATRANESEEMTLIAEIAASLVGLIESIVQVVEVDKSFLEGLQICLNLVAFTTIASDYFARMLLQRHVSSRSNTTFFLSLLNHIFLTITISSPQTSLSVQNDNNERRRLKYIGQRKKSDVPTEQQQKELKIREGVFWVALECLENLSLPRQDDDDSVKGWEEWLREQEAILLLLRAERTECVIRTTHILTRLARFRSLFRAIIGPSRSISARSKQCSLPRFELLHSYLVDPPKCSSKKQIEDLQLAILALTFVLTVKNEDAIVLLGGTSHLIGGLLLFIDLLTTSIWEDRNCQLDRTIFKLCFAMRLLHFLIFSANDHHDPQENFEPSINFRSKISESQESYPRFGVYQSAVNAFSRLAYSPRPEWLIGYANLKSIAEAQRLAADLIEEIMTPQEIEEMYDCFQENNPEESTQKEVDDGMDEEDVALFLEDFDADELRVLSQPAQRNEMGF